jgi:PleD family two-component response regulator
LLDEAGVTPIIAITGRSDNASAHDAVEAGAQDYLVKGSAQGHAAIAARRSLMKRLGVHDLPGLVRFAVRVGLVERER